MKTCLLAGCLIAVLAAAPAQAGWKTDRANLIAYEVWDDELSGPCPDGLAIRFDDPARWDSEDASAWAWQGVCVVYLDKANPDLRAWEPFCSDILHEAGHIAGYDHDHKGHGGIMAALGFYAWSTGRVNGRKVSGWTGTDRRCRDRGRPFLERRGLLRKHEVPGRDEQAS